MTDLREIAKKMEACKVYTYKEMIHLVCPSQSFTAERIMDDLRASGNISYAIDSTGHTGYKLVQ